MSYVHSRTTRLVLRSLVPVICPPEAAPLADAIVDHMALTFATTGPLIQRAFAAGMLTYDLGAMPRYLRRAHALPPDKAERYYRTWEHGPTPLHTQLARALNQLMSLSCYEQPEMAERIGYRPAGWIVEVTKKRLAVYGDDIRTQERQILAPDPLRKKREVA
jgi:hypothetical protein